MAASIPFDHPSLVLGHVVNTDLLQLLEKIAALQARTDAAFERMNSFIAMRRGLSMTINELVGLGVDIGDLKTKIAELNQAVSQAASDYMVARIANDTGVRTTLEAQGMIVPKPLALDKVTKSYSDEIVQYRAIAKSINLQAQ